MNDNVDMEHLLWIDMEMTGLDPVKNQILEIASILTDKELTTVAKGPRLVVHCDLAVLEAMDSWNRKNHRTSGLWEEAIASNLSLQEAEQQSVAFVRKHSPHKKLILSGNSIWQDRRFIMRYMPDLNACLHYRMVDVSSLKVLNAMWSPPDQSYDKKQYQHRALADIEESIAELRYYRKHLFASTDNR